MELVEATFTYVGCQRGAVFRPPTNRRMLRILLAARLPCH